jgi:DNA-binding NarL/FixJ family response regulator
LVDRTPLSPSTNQHESESFSKLTPREWNVLHLASEGQTNVEIAMRLHISRHTVAQHIAKMLRRTGALNRTDLVTRAYKAGALPSSL